MSRTKTPLYRELAALVQARLNCIERNNTDWLDKHSDTLKHLADNFLPSGGGIDNGTEMDLDASNERKLVLVASYHHMHESGMYDGWTTHTITVTPSFDGIDLRISGKNRNDIKEYLYDVYHCALCEEVYQDEDGNWHNATQEDLVAKYAADKTEVVA